MLLIVMMLFLLIVVSGCSNVSQNNTEKTKVTETEVKGSMQEHSNSNGGQVFVNHAVAPVFMLRVRNWYATKLVKPDGSWRG
jgi:uncharacterized protein YceK